MNPKAAKVIAKQMSDKFYDIGLIVAVIGGTIVVLDAVDDQSGARAELVAARDLLSQAADHISSVVGLARKASEQHG